MTTKSLLITTAFLAALTLNASSQLVLSDSYDYTPPPAGLNADINANIPARQGGTMTTTYTESFVNPVAGVTVALEDASTALSGSPDALFLRTQTSPTVGTVSNENISLNSNFTSLTGSSWTVDYRARLTVGVAALGDTFFGLGFGSTAAPNGPGSDGFFFALRDTGAWLLWRNGAASFANGQLANFTAQQEYSVNLAVNETGVNPLLSVAVTPLGGSSQVIGNNLPLNTLGASRLFAYQSSVVSDANGGFTDVRATDLAITVVPEPSTAVYGLFGIAGLLFAGRRLKGQSKA